MVYRCHSLTHFRPCIEAAYTKSTEDWFLFRKTESYLNFYQNLRIRPPSISYLQNSHVPESDTIKVQSRPLFLFVHIRTYVANILCITQEFNTLHLLFQGMQFPGNVFVYNIYIYIYREREREREREKQYTHYGTLWRRFGTTNHILE